MRSSQSVSKVNHIHALFFTDKSFIWSSEAIDSGATTKWGNVTFLRDGKKVEKQTVASRLRKKSDVEEIPMQEQWRRDIYTCYEHQCAEDVVEEAEDAREVDGREVGEDEGDEVMMARIISLKNSYALNKWGGKKWDGENSQWVVSSSEEANDETKDEPTASLEPSESEPLPPPAPTFTSFKVDFSLPVMNAFRAHFPALVSDDAEDRDFLRFLMFFADGDGDGGANEVNNDNEATAPKKTKNLRRASICV